MTNVVLYLRYSSANQTEQSIEGQERVCRQYCEMNNLNIINTYIDRGKSAYTNIHKRVSFLQMIDDSKKHTYKAVIVYSLSRFSRNKYDIAFYKKELEKNGVKVLSATEGIKDDPEGELLEGIIETMDVYFSRELSRKVKRGMQQSAEKGLFVGGNIPLGYDVVDKHFVINEDEAPIIKLIYRLYSEGYSFRDILEELDKHNYKNKKGKKFTKRSFESILTNEKYIGVYESQGYRHENLIPPIVDVSTFDKVQNRLDLESKNISYSRYNYMLSGKVYCANCHSLMTGESAYKKEKVYLYYTCKNKDLRVNKEELEKLILRAIKSFLNDDFINDLAEHVVKENERKMKENIELIKLQQELDDAIKLEEALKGLLKNAPDTIGWRYNDACIERDRLEKAVFMEKTKQMFIDKKQVVEFFNYFLNGDYEDEEYQKELFTLLVNRVEVSKEKVDVYFNINSMYNCKLPQNDTITINFDSSQVVRNLLFGEQYTNLNIYYIYNK